MKIIIVLDVEGDDAESAFAVVDDLLDEGVIQDALAEACEDRGIDVEVKSATTTAA